MIVRGVGEDTPAARAGLQPADIITSIDGTAIPTTGELFRVLRGHKPGDTISISLVRLDSQARVTGRPTVLVRLAEAPAG